jgi:hypothetical protein
MRLASTGFIVALLAALTANPARAFTDAELIDGFQRTVFGSEYQSFGWQSHLVKKYVDPIRLYVDDRSSTPRRETIENFVRTLPGLIAGLDVEVRKPDKRISACSSSTNDYQRSSQGIYNGRRQLHAGNACAVVSTSAGISRSTQLSSPTRGNSSSTAAWWRKLQGSDRSTAIARCRERVQ